ncbi:hypothetical protein [Anaeromyxobacter dehalogenans]|uniref:Polymer-forming cytoskeletal protein n=1 Tax=Anaeromyxobacter dehalogenans (strain 2CP-C) TaxID=290397 RepID=Q2IL37_ANADE|nr:hypothetical protein [Anaeromyxobacter dehalogenans]ABC82368.1 hypothetical protein Adeh_2598 [Anaeromyxobacter dehalogenans 2CP-C]
MRARLAAATLAALLPVLPAVGADQTCRVRVGPAGRFAQDRDVVIGAGERVTEAVAVHGDVIVRAGGQAEKAAALSGNVVVQRGGEAGEVVSVGGEVRLEDGAHVSRQAVSLGGRVDRAAGARVDGEVTSLSLEAGAVSLRGVMRAAAPTARCSVVQDPSVAGVDLTVR